MPVRFWGEAILTAAHLINITPTKVLNNRTPHEVLFGTKPSYDHLRIFGSACFTHLRSRDKDKFGARCYFKKKKINVNLRFENLCSDSI